MPENHEVFNQVPACTGYDVADDAALAEALGAFAPPGMPAAEPELHELGRLAGSDRVSEWDRLANENEPVLHTHDRVGDRIDEVEYHPYWHELMAVAVGHGLHAAAWQDAHPGAHLARAAKLHVWGQAEAGHLCPISMTYASVPALRASPELAAAYEPLLASREYDFGLREPGGKRGLLAGMSMTEKQGGSDVRANTTRATPTGDGHYSLSGHKWFTSAPMSDLFFTLAQAPGGLACFLLPRVLPDGSRNRIRVQRLKDKLGNRSNASAELEYDGALGWLVGEPGRGVATIIEMVNHTRLDCAIAGAAGMRNGVVRAVHHARHRQTFGQQLSAAPLMRNVLADLAVEAEAATFAALRLAAAGDRRPDEHERDFRRLGLAVTKYWVCKRAPAHAAEALECLGGNGYVEGSGMPRLYREAPLTSIWEGSGNVAALDVLRAMGKQAGSVQAFLDELDRAAGADARLDEATDRLRKELTDPSEQEYRARRIVETMGLVLQGSLLVRHGNPAVADAFCASRLAGDCGRAFGTLPPGVDTAAIIERAAVTG
jgi:putative acyl-CoA dehydrogenase